MNNKNGTIIIFVVLVAVLAAAYMLLTKGKEKPVNAPVSTPSEEMIVETETSESPSDLPKDTSQEKFTPKIETIEINIKAQNFSFEPREIKVKVGETVKINLENVEGFHDLVIDEFNVAIKQIGAGQTDIIEFTADKAGEFEYYCSIGNHRAMGMVGKLIVEE